ncbi:MAG: hypothetical protein P4L76_18295 [Beijerinckiaceae bacterium]|nr:hypothetical protein [Beijerinckiaceae bacterium]
MPIEDAAAALAPRVEIISGQAEGGSIPASDLDRAVGKADPGL